MEANKSLEDQVKALQRQFGGIARLVKDLKSAVEKMEKKNAASENSEVQEIIETQKVIDEIIVANSDAIKRMDKEIREINKKQIEDKSKIDATDEVIGEGVKAMQVRKKCKYKNRGFCKYKTKCRFVHPDKVCEIYLEKGTCDQRECSYRHPKSCKWLESNGGCRRKDDCDYSHKIKPAQKEVERFDCVSCKHTWSEEKFVVKHIVKNMEVFFCLNCEDWVQYKSNVLDHGWTLFDQDGNLDYNV